MWNMAYGVVANHLCVGAGSGFDFFDPHEFAWVDHDTELVAVEVRAHAGADGVEILEQVSGGDLELKQAFCFVFFRCLDSFVVGRVRGEEAARSCFACRLDLFPVF